MNRKDESMDGASLTGCYGRVYKTSATIKADFEAGKDFKLNKITNPWDGKPCSIRDMVVGETVKLRYGINGPTQFIVYTKKE